MREVPACLVGRAQVALKLLSAHALFRIHHERHSHVPLFEAQVRIVEDRPSVTENCFLQRAELSCDCAQTHPSGILCNRLPRNSQWHAKMQKVALVVDDNGSVRAYVKAALEGEGFRTLEAEDGELGLELVRKIGADIDLVISDIKMPKLDGIQLANWVRAEFPTIPIILISGYTDVALEKVPGVEFIPKPFLFSTLLNVVRKMVAMARTATPDSTS